MPVYAGNKNLALYWGAGDAQGMSNVRLYLGDKLVYIPFRPPEGDLLLAGSGTYLKGGADVYLDYKNTSRLLEDSLSGKDIGYGPFDISFEFTPKAGYTGTRYLFEVPGLARFGYDIGKGYGLIVYLAGLGWRSVGTAYISQEEVEVRLYRTAKNTPTILSVADTNFTLDPGKIIWESWLKGSSPSLTTPIVDNTLYTAAIPTGTTASTGEPTYTDPELTIRARDAGIYYSIYTRDGEYRIQNAANTGEYWSITHKDTGKEYLAFECGQLRFFSNGKEIKNLILKDSYGG